MKLKKSGPSFTTAFTNSMDFKGKSKPEAPRISHGFYLQIYGGPSMGPIQGSGDDPPVSAG